MIRSTLLLFSLVTLAFTASAQSHADEYAAVAKTVNYYLEGGNQNNFEMLSKAFHETATMKYLTDDGYQEVNALAFFKKGMNPDRPKPDRSTRIVSIDVSGHAANAKLEIEYPTFTFVDYMNLLKIDGEWKIVSKIFYRRS